MTYKEKLAFLSVTLRSLEVTDFSLENLQDITLADLLNISLEKDKKISFRAAWVFETIVLKDTSLLKNVLQQFFDNIKIQNNWSCLRSYSKILLFLTSQKNKEYRIEHQTEEDIIEHVFQWMINEQCPVAVLVNCLDILNNLSKKHVWINEELQAQITHFQLTKPSPALMSRTNKIINKRGYGA